MRIGEQPRGFDWKGTGLIVAIIVVLLAALYLTFIPQSCDSFECFNQNMAGCSGANYINEEAEASWEYRIKGQTKGTCEIEVTLLSAKEGSLDLRQYEGNTMSCFYEKGVIALPEKNLDACTGQLKENLQEVIIDSLYEYVVDNVDEIGEVARGI